MLRLHAAVIGAMCVAGALAPARCLAQPTMRWSSSECPAERPLTERVVELRGEPPRSDVEVRVERDREALEMRITLDGEPIRTLRGDSCGALFEAAAVVIALAEAQRETQVQRETEPQQETQAQRDTEPQQETQAQRDTEPQRETQRTEARAEALGRPDPAPPPARGERLAFALAPSVAASAMIGLLPTVSAGPALGLDVTLEWARLRVALAYLAPSTAPGAAGTGVQVEAWAATAALCVRIVEGPPSPSICAQASVALLPYSVVGGATTGRAQGFEAWASFGGAVALDVWDFQPGRLWVEVAMGVAPREYLPTFQHSVESMDGRTTNIAFTPETFSGRLALGASFDFGM